MNSNKCPKCGLITSSKATVCRNCSHQFAPINSENSLPAERTASAEQPGSWIDTFCGLNLLGASIVCGVIFCLYWNSYVLSNFLPSGRYPIILLILFYLPAGILAIVCGGVWYGILRTIFKAMGFRVSESG